jgi:hypothetical protein
LIFIVAKLNENPEIHNFEGLSEKTTILYETLRKLKGNEFDTEYLKKRKSLRDAKQKYKEEEKLLSVTSPQM